MIGEYLATLARLRLHHRNRLHVIFIPGLGEKHLRLQKWVLTAWKMLGVKTDICPMYWGADEPWAHKFDRLLLAVDRQLDCGGRVGLIGASAGAAPAICVLASRQTKPVRVVIVAGKVRSPHTLDASIADSSPAVKEAVVACEEALTSLRPETRRQLMSQYALRDRVVPAEESMVPGADGHVLPVFGHAAAIAWTLTCGAPSSASFLKGDAEAAGRFHRNVVRKG